MTNLRHVCLATQNLASSRAGQIPPIEDRMGYGWPVSLLAYFDRQDLVGNTQFYGTVSVPLLTCPVDRAKWRKPDGLSYVMNAGYGKFQVYALGSVTEIGVHSAEIDLNGDGEVDKDELQINRATGVSWRIGPDKFRMTLDFIGGHDGISQTMLLTENMNAGNWASGKTMDMAFVIGRNAITFAPDPDGTAPLALKEVKLGAFGINVNKGKSRGASPAPSSVHDGIVNVMFCDGHGQTMSEKIDPTIYARLMTPAGNRYGQTPLREDEIP